MDGLEFAALVTGIFILLVFFHPVAAMFYAIVWIVASIIYVANR